MDTLEIAKVLRASEYSVAATGFRGVSEKELAEVLTILLTTAPEEAVKKLEELYANHPSTIQLNRELAELQCRDFDADHCFCFLPNAKSEDCWQQVQRRQRLE